MQLFPIGQPLVASSLGSLCSTKYPMFEPNGLCTSNEIYNVLVTKFQDQTMQTRRKGLPFLTINYKYDSIFTREYRQIEHFVKEVGEGLDSFNVIDFSKGTTVSNVASTGNLWRVSVDETRVYSATANMRANRAFIWDGSNYKEGAISAIVVNTTVDINVLASNFGKLTLTKADSDSILYPMYTVYLAPGAISNFKTSNYFPGNKLMLTKDGGYMYTGELTFITKYKV